MDFALTEDQLRFKQAAREFLSKEVVPYRAEWDRRESVDPAIIGKLGELGFFGLTIPEEYGGLGGDYITYCIGMEELGRADSAVRGIVSVSMGLFGKSVLSHGSEEQKQEWLPGIASGTKLGCFALTEPDNGSDAGNLKTRARPVGRRLDHQRHEDLHHQRQLGRCLRGVRPHRRPGPRGVSAFLVPTGTPGFGRTEIHGKLGLRGQVTSELNFTDVRVPAGAMLGAEGEGFKIAMHSLDKGRVSVAAGCTGISQACLEAVVEYTGSRSQFGRPIAGFQLIQDMIAEISVDTDAARLLTWRAADLIERGLPFRTEASKAKFFASEKAVKAANLAIQAFGGYGYIDEYPVQKFMRDARVMTLYEGTSQIQKLLIGRAETGVSAFWNRLCRRRLVESLDLVAGEVQGRRGEQRGKLVDRAGRSQRRDHVGPAAQPGERHGRRRDAARPRQSRRAPRAPPDRSGWSGTWWRPAAVAAPA